MRRSKVVSWTMACALALAPAAFAQVATANIYGTVSDDSGAVIPGATLTLSGEFGTRSTDSPASPATSSSRSAPT